jgi:hypothetical protein
MMTADPSRSDFPRVENLVEELRKLAGLTRRLLPSHRDPHEFHQQKDLIAKRLAELARQAEAGAL